jgi:hypothetical protein
VKLKKQLQQNSLFLESTGQRKTRRQMHGSLAGFFKAERR